MAGQRTNFLIRHIFFLVALAIPRIGLAADGDLDPTFGADLVLNQFDLSATVNPPFMDEPLAMARQADGKLVVVGYSWQPGSMEDFTIWRYLPDGSLDPSFGASGVVVVAVPDAEYNSEAAAVAIQDLGGGDERIVVGGSTINFTDEGGLLDAAAVRLNPDGSLDDGGPADSTPADSFGQGGIVRVDVDPLHDSNETVEALAVADDGRIALVGRASIAGQQRVLVVMLAADGQPAAGFGDAQGALTFAFDPTNPAPYESAVGAGFDLGGDLLLAGAGSLGADWYSAVARLSPAGELVPTFADAGVFLLTDRSTMASDMVLRDGKVTVLAERQDASRFDFLRLDAATGAPDLTFSGNGLAVAAVNTSQLRTRALDIDDSRRVWASGFYQDRGDLRAVFVRLTPSGDFDSSFGINGRSMLQMVTGGSTTWLPELGLDLLTAADGTATVAVSQDNGPNDYNPALLRLTTDGGIDPGSLVVDDASDGTLVQDLTYGYDLIQAIGILPDGRFYTAGITWADGPDPDASTDEAAAGEPATFLGRHLADGMPDTTFFPQQYAVAPGQVGKRLLPLSKMLGSDPIDDLVADLVIDDQGRILVAGAAQQAGLDRLSYIARFTEDGLLDTSFGAGDSDGVDGLVALDLSPVGEMTQQFVSLTIAPDGSIVAAGTAVVVAYLGVWVARFDPDGALDASFGDNGLLNVGLDPAMSYRPRKVLLDDAGRVLVVGYGDAGLAPSSMMLIRLLPDGGLDPSFSAGDGDGLDGVLFFDASGSGGWNEAHDALIEPDGGSYRIVVAGSARENTIGDMAAARFLEDGSVDTSFGGDGVVLAGFADDSGARSLVRQPDGKYLLAGRSGDDMAVVRLLPDGSLDGSFGAGGRELIDIDGRVDLVSKVALTRTNWQVLLAGLSGGRTALVRLQNTSNGPPAVETRAADAVGAFGATLHGLINANNDSTQAGFDLGPDAGYGQHVLADQSPVDGFTDTPVAATLAGLEANTTYHFRATGENAAGASAGQDRTFTTPLAAPEASTLAASAVVADGATLNGSVDAHNAQTSVHFEYGLDTGYGSQAPADQDPLGGSGEQAVSAAIGALAPNTAYHYRVVASNAAGTVQGIDATFTTAAVVPTVVTGAASDVLVDGATVHGTVNARNSEADVSFEYGLDTGYGSVATAVPATVAGDSDAEVSAALVDLQPATTYHYRVLAGNAAGEARGEDASFTTAPLIPTITSAEYDAAGGVLVVAGTDLRPNPAGADIDPTRLLLSGQEGASHRLGAASAASLDSQTRFTVTLSAEDRLAVNALLNANGTAARDGSAYDLAADDDWCPALSAGDSADPAGNPVTVSGVGGPSLDVNEGLDCAEGQSAAIGVDRLSASDPDSPDSALIFGLTRGPAHGRLELADAPGQGVDRFSQADLAAGRLRYVHDGSETTEDDFAFVLSDEYDSLSEQTFAIRISPVDDQAPTLLTNAGLTVAQGGQATLGSEQLSATDADSDDAGLTYTLTDGPGHGRLERADQPGEAVVTFRQQDLDDEALRYVHDGSAGEADTFTFSLSDGDNELAGQVFAITVVPAADGGPDEPQHPAGGGCGCSASGRGSPAGLLWLLALAALARRRRKTK